MRLNFSLLTSLAAAALAPFASAAIVCPEAARFGALSVTPSTAAPGDSITVNVNMACSQQLGYMPTYMDYYIEVLANNNGHEAPILLARRTYDASQGLTDTFTTQVPEWFYFSDAVYSVVYVNSFAKSGPNNNSVITTGSISTPLNITGI
ncbi:hypothetical protein B0H10DRAFT_1800072 [Mycena sp. CBHHK59/15]|nr:hypothetical protein B0H10DRAFT_1800072 [Mycena sp. CBHHK59/15]